MEPTPMETSAKEPVERVFVTTNPVDGILADAPMAKNRVTSAPAPKLKIEPSQARTSSSLRKSPKKVSNKDLGVFRPRGNSNKKAKVTAKAVKPLQPHKVYQKEVWSQMKSQHETADDEQIKALISAAWKKLDKGKKLAYKKNYSSAMEVYNSAKAKEKKKGDSQKTKKTKNTAPLNFEPVVHEETSNKALPTTTLRKIAQLGLDGNKKMTGEAMYLVNKISERFLRHMTEKTWSGCASKKRKMIRSEDFYAFLRSSERVRFLRATLFAQPSGANPVEEPPPAKKPRVDKRKRSNTETTAPPAKLHKAVA